MWPINTLRRSIRVRLIAGLGLGLVPVAAIAVGAFLVVGFATGAIHGAVSGARVELIPVTEQYRAALRAQHELHTYALGDAYNPEAFRRFSEQIDRTFELLGQVAFTEEAETALLRKAGEEWIAVKAIGEELYLTGPTAVDDRARLLPAFDSRSSEFLDTLQELQDFIVAELAAQPDLLREISSRVLIGVVAVSVLAIALLAFVGIWVLRSILGPIRSLRDSADRFGAGDLGHRISLPYPDEFGVLGHTFNAMADQLEASLTELKDISVRDELTGLFNRREFNRRLFEEEIKRAHRYGRPVSLLILDLDNLKEINDEYGHPSGDEALRHVSRSIVDQVRPVDSVSRYGGDEFVVMAPETDSAEALAMAERVRESVSFSPVLLPLGDHAHLSVSIGIATFPRDAHSAEELVNRADLALYQAKSAGRDQVRVATSSSTISTPAPPPTPFDSV